MKAEKCKGFTDLTPDDMRAFRYVEDTFRDCCLGWGYDEIRTPTLEYLYLFTSAGTLTPNMLGKVYSFLDWDGWSGERVVLKPDGTIPTARFYISNNKSGLARLFYVTNLFMFEETGKKSREKWQCGVELIGVNSALSDIELLSLSLDVLRQLGLSDIRIKLSHAGLIKALLDSLELSSEEKNNIFSRILEGDSAALDIVKMDKPETVEALNLLLGLKGKTSGFLKNVKALSSKRLANISEPLDNFICIVEKLEKLGVDYRIDLASGKGFEYYTGLIFHLLIGQNVIGGGGRYDALIPQMGGQATPAAGFAIYMDQLMKLIEPESLAELDSNKILVRIETDAMEEGFNLAEILRDFGYIVVMQLEDKQETDYGWKLEVVSKGLKFALTNIAGGETTKTDDACDILKLLGCTEDVA
ncbi:MAG: ATP phosphoribosyltransferase regulatory subunit [Dehalococcoidales bacterium]|nr:ATP phosphoribosyltransferase regulatory subunit [Dehalococcoidales bacterium]